MSNLNKIFLMGRLTREPELRYTPQGAPVTDLGLAVNREYNVQGDRRKETMFIDVTFWKGAAETLCKYLNKGSPIFVEGRLSMDTWEGQDGQKRTRYKVMGENFQFIGGGSRGGGEGGGGGFSPGARSGGGEESFGGDYGGNYRQGGGAPAHQQGGGAPMDAPPAGDGFGPGPGISDDDIPF